MLSVLSLEEELFCVLLHISFMLSAYKLAFIFFYLFYFYCSGVIEIPKREFREMKF